MATTNELTALGLFRSNLDHDIKLQEKDLRTRIEYLERELARAKRHLDEGTRVTRSGCCQQTAVEIDQVCRELNDRYDTRNALNAAIAHDEKAAATKNGAS